MDIAYVFSAVYPFVPGGVQRRVYEIGRRLSVRGHDVTVYGRHFWDGESEIEYEGLTFRAVAAAADLYTEAGRRSITEAIGFSSRVVPALRRRQAEHDVVVVSPFVPVLASEVAVLGTETALVTTWHEVWLDYWEEYLGALAPCGKLVERLAATVPQQAVAVSGLTADRLARIGPAREEIKVVYNGIDVEEITTAPLPPEANGRRGYDVLFAGRLVADKRVDVLLNAFDRVADAYDATLGIVGDGPEADRLRARAANLGCADRVEFLDYLEQEEVFGQMRAASVFASPSTREGFGLTYLEAMAAGCTVVGVDHPESAASEVIDSAGYLPAPTVDGVTEALDAALAGETPLKNPQSRARQFNWDNVATRAETVYREAIEDR